VINGRDDEDGCPDEGVQLVRLLPGEIELGEAIQFDTDSERILERSFGLMNQIAALLKNHDELRKVRIEGHTDSRAPHAHSLELSQRRADAVARCLVEAGVDPVRLVAVGYGETRPIASNKSRAGREMNRRIELIVTEQEEYFEAAPGEPEVAPDTPGGANRDGQEHTPARIGGDAG
jgi:outer membrane protein OmpA-like peptidoglycan-associated protein